MATDDDYIPFVEITGHDSPLAAERLVGQMHRPPPPPIPHGSEPEIILKVSELFEEEVVAETNAETERGMKMRWEEEEEEEGEEAPSAVDTMEEPPQNKRSRKREKPDRPKDRCGKQGRKPRLEALDQQQSTGEKPKKKKKKKREKAKKKSDDVETGIPGLTIKRSGNWSLPSIEDQGAITPNTKLQHHVATTPHRKIELWRIQKAALERKFGPRGWDPLKKLSPEALDGIRALHAQHPDIYTSPKLADLFRVPPEAIRRILKSSWRPNPEEAEERHQRWADRGKKIFDKMVQDGVIKTKAMKKKERKARDKRDKWEAVADRGPSNLPMSDRIF